MGRGESLQELWTRWALTPSFLRYRVCHLHAKPLSGLRFMPRYTGVSSDLENF